MQQGNEQPYYGRKILVVYASQFGSTGEVAQVIGDVLISQGHNVVIKAISQVNDISSYEAVIIGGAIQYDRWMAPARKFVYQHQEHLSKIPFACFFNCLTLSRKDEASVAQAKGYAKAIEKLVIGLKPVDVHGFAGVLDYSKMSIPVRIVAKIIFLIIGVKEGDYRDWGAIKIWAYALDKMVFKN